MGVFIIFCLQMLITELDRKVSTVMYRVGVIGDSDIILWSLNSPIG